MAASKLPKYRLFSGHVTKYNKKDKTIAVEGELEVVAGKIIFAEPLRTKDTRGTLLAYKTDATGQITYYHPKKKEPKKKAPHFILDQARTSLRVVIPPPNWIMMAYAAKGKSWAKAMQEQLAKTKKKCTLQLCKLTKSQLKEPHTKKAKKKPAKEPTVAEKKYAAWHGKLNAKKPFYGYVICKLRGVFLFFSNADMAGAKIELKTPKGKTLKATASAASDGIVTAAVTAFPSILTKGTYTISVTTARSGSGWSPKFKAGSNFAYSLKEQLTFSIQNMAGEFEALCADPISVEEATIVQFPDLYGHLVDAAKKKESYPELKISTKFSIPNGLKPYAKRLAWTFETSKMVRDLIDAADSKTRAKMIGDTIVNALPLSEDKNLKNVVGIAQNSVNLAFNLGDLSKAYDGLEVLSKGKILKDLGIESAGQWNDIKKSLEVTQYWRSADPIQHVLKCGDKSHQQVLLKLKDLPKKEQEALLDVTNLQKRFGIKMEKLNKGIAIADAIYSGINLGIAVYNLIDKIQKKEATVADLKSLLGSYKDLFLKPGTPDGATSRGAFVLLEKYRSTTVMQELGIKKQEMEVWLKAVDTALAILSCIPATAPAAQLISAIKAVGQTSYQLICCAAKSLDGIMFDHHFSKLLADRKLLNMIHSRSHANQVLMDGAVLKDKNKHGGKDDLHTQLRVRAEAINALVALITRAAIAVPSGFRDKDYRVPFTAKLREYHVADFIKYVVLQDGWQAPIFSRSDLTSSTPLTLDAYWLYTTNSKRGANGKPEFSGLVQSTKVTANKLNTPSIFPKGALYFLRSTHTFEGNAQTNFQKYFPIHRLDSASIEDFAWQLRTTFGEVHADCIKHACVYKRPRNYKPKGKKAKDGSIPHGWQKIHDGKELKDIPPVSPYDQIRVLVVLKRPEDDQNRGVPHGGIYPISIQQMRIDPCPDVGGAVYKDIVKPLDPYLLKEEKKKYEGHLGCVFYPYFMLGKGTVPGTKPMIGSSFWRSLNYELDQLSYMRYGYKVKVARNPAKFLKYGPPGKQIDEFPVDASRHKYPEFEDVDFLKLRGMQSVYPELFKQRKRISGIETPYNGAGPCFLKATHKGNNGTKWQLITDDILLDGFDWTKPVELVVMVWADDIAAQKRRYEKTKLDWKALPMRMELVGYNKDGKKYKRDCEGPTYNSTLHFIGRYDFRGAMNKTNSKAFTKENQTALPGDLVTISNAVEAKSDIIKTHLLGAGVAKNSGHKYYLFGAHYALYYYPPGHTGRKPIKGLRPFCKRKKLKFTERARDILKDSSGKPVRKPAKEYYHVAIDHVETAAKSGFKQDDTVRYEKHDLVIGFTAPSNYIGPAVPWPDAGEVALKDWIQHETYKVDGRAKTLKT